MATFRNFRSVKSKQSRPPAHGVYDVASIFQVMDSVRQVGVMFFTVIAIR